jgi:hypothetical protein
MPLSRLFALRIPSHIHSSAIYTGTFLPDLQIPPPAGLELLSFFSHTGASVLQPHTQLIGDSVELRQLSGRMFNAFTPGDPARRPQRDCRPLLCSQIRGLERPVELYLEAMEYSQCFSFE